PGADAPDGRHAPVALEPLHPRLRQRGRFPGGPLLDQHPGLGAGRRRGRAGRAGPVGHDGIDPARGRPQPGGGRRRRGLAGPAQAARMRGAAGLAVSFLAGYVALSYEILWYRVFSFASGGAAPTFALLLAAYLLGLAAGAKLSARLCRRVPGETARQQGFLADYLVLANVLGYLLIPGLIR